LVCSVGACTTRLAPLAFSRVSSSALALFFGLKITFIYLAQLLACSLKMAVPLLMLDMWTEICLTALRYFYYKEYYLFVFTKAKA
jgi:hypothetical protein